MEISLVSVCVPVFNHEKYVRDSIQSIIDQDYKNIELIIIDDGSFDRSVECVKKLCCDCERRFRRFKYIHRENRGLCTTLNEALSWCQGEYFSVLASDDMWLPDKISIQVDYLIENKNSLGVFGGIQVIDEKNKVLRTKVLPKLNKYFFEQIFLSQAFLPAPTALFRASHVQSVGGFNPNYKVEDWYICLRLTESNSFSLDCLPIVVANYRRHATNVSKNYELMLREQRKIIGLYKDNPFYKKSELSIMLAAYTVILPCNKIKAIQLLPSFIRLWRERRFWFAVGKLFIPRSILLKYFN